MSSGALIVAGASSDVGIALIKRVAANYDQVICHYCSSISLIEELREQFGDKIIPIQADFADKLQTERFIEEALSKCLKPYHFVHLSSSVPTVNGKFLVKFSKTDWLHFEQELNISFRSAVTCCQAFAPLMAKARSGKIVLMLSSQTVWEPSKSYSTAYICVKHALLGLVKSLSAEYIGHGVTVNGVSPAMIDTKFLQVPDIVRQMSIDASPVKRLLTVHDVVPTFEFLLSAGANTVTGQNIAVTAGC